MPPTIRRAVALVATLLLLAAAGSAVRAASPAPARGPRGMVVAPEPLATRVGLEVLRRGGNAADAAVAVAMALAVTHPRAGNLGGGGFLLYRTPDGRHAALDFRETAPRDLRPEAFLDAEGRPVPARSLDGGLAVGVPGSVAGLAEAHRRWGSRPWRELVEPAIRLARDGVTVSRLHASQLAEEVGRLRKDPAARAIFTRDGTALAEGDRLVQKDLARTLATIAAEGPEAFYRGPLAEALVAAVRARGGVLRVEDLEAYRVVEREPLVASYRGLRVVTFPPPSSGGVILLQILGMIEPLDLSTSGAGSSRTVHRLVEAERRAFADRSRWLGDPAFFRNPVRGLLDPAYLAARWSSFRPNRATPSRRLSPGSPASDEPTETLHLSIADARGAAIALTTTLNGAYGAAFVAEGTGVLLNNEIDDFAIAPGAVNQFGLSGGRANAVLPGKRPLSTMTPTIVEGAVGERRPRLVLGSPGGPTIVTAVLGVLVNVVDHGMSLSDAVAAPRFHHQWMPDRIDHETGAFPEDVASALRRFGHLLRERPAIGNVAAIGIDPDGAWTGVADPRGEGAAMGY